MDNKINFIELNNDKSLVSQVADRVQESFKIFKGADLLIIDRSAKGDFIEVLAESLYEYKKGVILIERFFKKDKCKPKGIQVDSISDEDKKLIMEFTEFSNSIPKVAMLSEEERDEYTDKINDYKLKLKEIKPEKTTLKSYRYKNIILSEFDLIEDEALKVMSNLYSSFAISFLTASSWASLDSVGIALTTIEQPDYVDLVLIPVKQKDEE